MPHTEAGRGSSSSGLFCAARCNELRETIRKDGGKKP